MWHRNNNNNKNEKPTMPYSWLIVLQFCYGSEIVVSKQQENEKEK